MGIPYVQAGDRDAHMAWPIPFPGDLVWSGFLSLARYPPSKDASLTSLLPLCSTPTWRSTLQRDGPRNPNRSHSPNSITFPQDVTNPQLDPTGHVKRPTFFSRNSGKSSPQKTSPLGSTPDELTVLDEDIPEEAGIIPSESSGSGFVLVESPHSKARAMKALHKEREEAARRAAAASGLMDNPSVPSAQSEPMLSQSDNPRMPPSDTMASLTYGVPPMNRVKGLPTPPIGPVIPDFDDLVVSRTRSRQRAVSTSDGQRDLGVPEDGSGLRRKTSMVKKIKERIK